MRIQSINTNLVQPYAQWREEHTNITMPANPSDSDLLSVGIRRVIETPRPEVSPMYTVKDAGVDASGVQQWDIVELPIGNQATVLENYKTRLHQQVSRQRDIHEQSGFQYRDKRVHSDPISVQRIMIAAHGALQASLTSSPFEVEWKCMGGESITLDAAGYLELAEALTAHTAAIHHHTQQLHGEIDAAVSLSDLQDIKTDIGWPSQHP